MEAPLERNIGFSIGFDVDGRVRDALMLAQEEDWVPAVEGDGGRRRGAWVTELTALADLRTWLVGTRLICRRDGLTRRPAVALRHRDGFPPHLLPHRLARRRGSLGAAPTASRPSRGPRAAKACGLRNLPFEDFVRNEAWRALVLIAQDLLAWTARVCLEGAMAKAEPATLRYQLLHVGARLARRGRDLHLRIDAAWPWRDQLDLPSAACAPLSDER